MPRPLLRSGDETVRALRKAGIGRAEAVAVVAVAGVGVGLATARGSWAVHADGAVVLAELEGAFAPRWVWWSARGVVPFLVAAGVRPAVCWDLAAVHRVLDGGRRDDAGAVWAAANGLPPPAADLAASVRAPRQDGQLDLLAMADDDATDDDAAPDDTGNDWAPVGPVGPVGHDGYLRPGWLAAAAGTGGGGEKVRLGRAVDLARLALLVRQAQEAALRQLPDGRVRPTGTPLALLTARAESAAELLACELEHDGLPLNRATAEHTIAAFVGSRPRNDAEQVAARGARDAVVLTHLGSGVDLRNPVALRAALARLGIDVPDTRASRLTALREVHPVVPALLEWRKAERVDTTYGYRWLDTHVGADGRLRGAWRGSDGAGGRMTAAAGLHNLPAELRVAVAAEPGYRLVRADLGQVEPRVLAVVSADLALAATTSGDDLYAPVAARLGCDRPTAKVAVLAAMYGQTTGTAGAALRQMRSAYPAALAFLDAAEAAGRAGRDLRTFGGRLVSTSTVAAETDRAVAARGRYARNAVVQGAAAELFKAWAATVRQGLVPLRGRVVLCLHDELLLHVPVEHAEAAADLVHRALGATAAYWGAGSGVRFVADVQVVDRWTDAKN